MNTNNLKELVLASPNLEIVPIVSEDVTCGDYDWTVSNVSRCSIEKVATSSINDEQFLIYGNDEDDFLDSYLCHYEGDELSDDEIEQKAKEEYENLPWEEVILLWVDAY
jgi:hypothetical protein